MLLEGLSSYGSDKKAVYQDCALGAPWYARVVGHTV
jgi:hypothetical protein